MPVSTSINNFDPLDWVNDYTQPAVRIDQEVFGPILQFSLMWNLFERDACGKQATPLNIERAVRDAFSAGLLSVEPFAEHLTYFRDRSQRNGMTIDNYFAALNMSDASAKNIVRGMLAGSLTDPNNLILALLLVTHRVRNNLFHGEKEVALLHSQVELFRVINSLLATYLTTTNGAGVP
jgi:hypothetical protein